METYRDEMDLIHESLVFTTTLDIDLEIEGNQFPRLINIKDRTNSYLLGSKLVEINDCLVCELDIDRVKQLLTSRPTRFKFESNLLCSVDKQL